ncbi:VacJ family lipoprotein [Motilimonas sp. 1_MG-2023]|uniref:MlaA family lipoprotein n=1 Tax=Motilimonas sp. 1_MG-2023 TaxID=3062672 RepID=UPI0026E23600|nr:VacJ family lipoprotein [Motilimonas sp. 1_MG-2023]MDO6525015.1 VacJ family lipoprotein [Motilimonas sp. 1_MG-2023]
MIYALFNRLSVVIVGIFLFFSASVAAIKPVDDSLISDPFEGVNRVVWDFNYALDQSIYVPATKAYLHLPEGSREAINNFILNFDEPSSAVNHLLMLDIESSMGSVMRFVVNTTFGIGGLIDVAGRSGLKRNRAEFQSVLAMVGVNHGPYLMVPFYGPRTTRKLVGGIVDGLYFPFSEFTYFEYLLHWGTDALYKRAILLDQDPLIKQSLDSYIFIRDSYIQYQNFQTEGSNLVSPIGPSLSDEELEEFMNE